MQRPIATNVTLLMYLRNQLKAQAAFKNAQPIVPEQEPVAKSIRRRETLCGVSKDPAKERIRGVEVNKCTKTRDRRVHCGKNRMASAQSVRNSVGETRGVLNNKRKLLKVGDPGGVTRRNLDLHMEVFQSIVVSVESKFSVKKVVALVLDCLDNGIKLNVIGYVAETGV